MASYMRLRSAQFLSSSLFNISQQRVRSCFPFWFSPPCRNISSAASTVPAELPPPLSSSSLSLPLLLLPPERVTDQNANNNERVVDIPLFSLADNEVVKLPNRILPEEISDAHCVGSSHGWLAFVNRQNCGFYLVNIFSPSVSPEIIQLPPIESLPCIKSVVRDSSSNHVKMYNYDNNPLTPYKLSRLLTQRLAMSSAPNNGDNNCTVMISYGICQQPAFCRIGDTSWTPLFCRIERIGDTSWTLLENQLHKLYEEEEILLYNEIIYSNKDQLFYLLSHMGHIEAWDLRDHTSPKPTLLDKIPDLSNNELLYQEVCQDHYEAYQDYLVKLSGGDILYVLRHYAFIREDGTYLEYDGSACFDTDLPSRTTRFKIFKVEFGNGNIEYVPSIGDNALFLGVNQSFSLSTSDNPHLKPNSIYFSEVGDEYGSHDMGVYSLEDQSVTPLYHPFKFSKILTTPIWVFPSKD